MWLDRHQQLGISESIPLTQPFNPPASLHAFLGVSTSESSR
jgi:hypothetical protein